MAEYFFLIWQYFAETLQKIGFGGDGRGHRPFCLQENGANQGQGSVGSGTIKTYLDLGRGGENWQGIF